MVQSDIRRMSIECDRLGGINLGQGICDLPTEELVANGAIEAIRGNLATYSRFDGIAELRQKIAAKMKAFNGVDVDPESEVVVTVGSTGGFAMAVLATLEPGDEIILFEPYYGYHLNTVKILGVESRFVTLHPPDWTFDEDELRRGFGPKTRGVVVCTPSNPCGKVFSREELKTIGALCEKHDCWIYTDEIYEYIVYDDNRHLSIASIDEYFDRTITISGFSKTFSVTGWRIGYLAAPKRVSHAIGLLNDLFYVCAPTPLQWGVAKGLDIDASYYENLTADYTLKRDMLASALRDGGITPYVPQGAYYMLGDVSALGFESDRSAADRLLSDAGVASVPGAAFFRDPPSQMLRFCFAKDTADLEEACRRIRAFKRE